MNFEKKDSEGGPLNLASKFDGKDALFYVNYLELPQNQTKSIAKGSDNTFTRSLNNNGKSHLTANASGVYTLYHKPHTIWQSRPNQAMIQKDF
jgi:hypothetical protein